MLVFLSLSLLSNVGLQAQGRDCRRAENAEPMMIFGLGAASSWNTAGRAAVFGVAATAEGTAIKHWLEIQAGVTGFRSQTLSELDSDLVFKKPVDLSVQTDLCRGWASVGPTEANRETSSTIPSWSSPANSGST